MSNAEEWLLERRQALIKGDLVWFARQIPSKPSPDNPAIKVAFHKIRYNSLDIPAHLRHISGRWLRANGYTDLFGIPLLPEGQLPE